MNGMSFFFYSLKRRKTHTQKLQTLKNMLTLEYLIHVVNNSGIFSTTHTVWYSVKRFFFLTKEKKKKKLPDVASFFSINSSVKIDERQKLLKKTKS